MPNGSLKAAWNKAANASRDLTPLLYKNISD
jgi:hypothetical protein